MEKKYYIIGGIIFFLVIALVGVFLSSGGERAPQVSAELVWWKTFEDTENISEIITEYQKANKGVKITFVKKDAATYEQELINALASGTGPDIFSIHNDWLPKHMDKMSPMPDNLMTLRTYKDTFVDVAYADFVKENKIYAVPLSVDVLALFYNKDLLGSSGVSLPPKTWPEMIEAVKKITKVDQPGTFSRSALAMGTSTNVNRAVDVLSLLMLQDGTEFYNDSYTTATFDRQVSDPSSNSTVNPGEVALMFYSQFADPSKTSYTWNARSDFSVDAFTQGKLAMMLSYAYMMPIIQDKAPNLNWDVAPVPQPEGADVKINFANYWGEAVSKSSKNPAVAWDFLKYMTQRPQLEMYYAKHKLPASRKDIIASQSDDTEIGVFAESALTARSVYKPDANRFESVFLKMIDDVNLRNMDAIDALRSATQQINLTLQRF